MIENQVWAVLPVKPFPLAKLRLAGILRPAERAALARAMLEDVLDAIGSSDLDGTIIVSADENVLALARRRGLQTVVEPAPSGINHAITLAMECLPSKGGVGMIVIPTDLPHLSAGSVNQVAMAISSPRSAALVPASMDSGTNMLACRPAGVLRPCFGPNSFARHLEVARCANIQPGIVKLPEIARDLDCVEDIIHFMASPRPTRTCDFLASLHCHERLHRRVPADAR